MPGGSGVVLVIDRAAQVTEMEISLVAVCEVGELLSNTSAVKLYTPVAVGVPVIAPVEEFSERPGGSVPNAMLHVYGCVPLTALSVSL